MPERPTNQPPALAWPDEDPGGALVQAIPGIALLVDATGGIRYANEAVRTILGLEPAGIVGRRLEDLAHPDDAPRVAQLLGAPRGPGEIVPLACRLQHADSTWRAFNLLASTGRNDLIAVLAISRLQGLDAASLAGSPSRIAHDLNNHLSTILGFTELLLADLPAQDPFREDLEEIHRAGKNALAITARLSEMFNPRGES
ncbi:MAG: PAS domain-containing protein [Acidobacteriota bacterium]|nr:PAS domain-containing protein [Acidobacteriota bacterium]